jgi:hypothetical protein
MMLLKKMFWTYALDRLGKNKRLLEEMQQKPCSVSATVPPMSKAFKMLENPAKFPIRLPVHRKAQLNQQAIPLKLNRGHALLAKFL